MHLYIKIKNLLIITCNISEKFCKKIIKIKKPHSLKQEILLKNRKNMNKQDINDQN